MSLTAIPRRFGLRTLLIAAPLAAALLAWSASRPLEEVDAWIVVDQRSLAPRPANADEITAEAAPQLTRKSPRIAASLISQALRPADIANLPIVKRHADPVKWLAGALCVERRPRSRVVRISLTGPDRHQLRAIVDSVAATYAAAPNSSHFVRSLRVYRSESE